MGIASISYRSLKDASDEATAVAKKLDKYADSLHSNVYKKLNKYDGSWNSNVSTASSKVNTKISELRSEQRRYETYSTGLIDLRDECMEVDKAVRSKVSSLTASFKERNGIRNNHLENAVSYYFTAHTNKTAVGRYIGSKRDDWNTAKDYLKSRIKQWYNYDGGKELIKGMLLVVLDVAIAIAGVVAAVATFLAGTLTFWAVLVLVAALVGTAIAFQDAWSNYTNEKAAYKARQKGDPATGYRRSAINSYTDYLKSSYMFGEDGQTYHYNAFFNGLATGINIANLACTVITFASGAKKLLEKGYKWASGCTKVSFKEIFSKKGFNVFMNKFSDIGKSLKANGWQMMKDFGKQAFNNFGRGLKSEFWDFFKINDSFNLAGAASSIKNMLSIPRELISGGLGLLNIGKIALCNVILPSTTAFVFDSSDPTRIIVGKGGQMQYDFTDIVTIDSIKSVLSNGYDVIKDSLDIMFPKGMKLDVISQFSTPSDVNIAIPEVYFPEINISKTQNTIVFAA